MPKLELQNFGARNLSSAARMGALGSTWDSHFSEISELGTRSFVIYTNLVKSCQRMTARLLDSHFYKMHFAQIRSMRNFT
jgi:hypothetical protein